MYAPRFALPHSVTYFFLCQSPFSTSCIVFDSLSTSIDKALSVHPCVKILPVVISVSTTNIG